MDGEIHSFDEITNYDLKRDNILKINGYQIIRLSNLEVETELNSTINKIKSFITENLSHSHMNHGGPEK